MMVWDLNRQPFCQWTIHSTRATQAQEVEVRMSELYLQTWSSMLKRVLFVPHHLVVGFLRKWFGGNIKRVNYKRHTWTKYMYQSYDVSLLSLLNLIFRITSTVACDMDLTKYPMDEQECMLDLESCKSWKTTYTFLLNGHGVMSFCPIPRRLLLRGHCVSLVGEPEAHPRPGQTGTLPVHHHRLSLCHRDNELQVWWVSGLFCLFDFPLVVVWSCFHVLCVWFFRFFLLLSPSCIIFRFWTQLDFCVWKLCKFFLKDERCFFFWLEALGGYILCTEGIDQVRIAAEPGRRFK